MVQQVKFSNALNRKRGACLCVMTVLENTKDRVYRSSRRDAAKLARKKLTGVAMNMSVSIKSTLVMRVGSFIANAQRAPTKPTTMGREKSAPRPKKTHAMTMDMAISFVSGVLDILFIHHFYNYVKYSQCVPGSCGDHVS